MTEHAEKPGSHLLSEVSLLVEAVAQRLGPWLDQVAAADPAVAGDSPACLHCAKLAEALGVDLHAVTSDGLSRAANLVALLRAVLADRWEPGVIHMPGFRPTGHSS